MKVRPVAGACPHCSVERVWDIQFPCGACVRIQLAKDRVAREEAHAAKLAHRMQLRDARIVRAKRIPRTQAETDWRMAVGRITHTAIKCGLLPEPLDCRCVDCGRQADCYDHRDYSRPLDVEPVCIACNGHRHRGLMPASKTTADFRQGSERYGFERAPQQQAA